MPIPAKVRVGPFVYAVHTNGEHVSDMLVRSGKYAPAEVDHAELRIVVNPRQAIGQIRDSLLHEVLPACQCMDGMRRENAYDYEEHVHRISPTLLGVLRDNPDLVAYLLAEDDDGLRQEAQATQAAITA